MAYEVLARKWRPQQFGDIVGQKHVTQTLTNAIKSDRVAHAYLFVGPRGVGKTSTARILAKALNCRKGPTPEPCDQCDSCVEIMAGNNLDVLEIDAASNTGVDNVRELRENVRYAPTRGPFKVYIIDEVHMLSPAAFNALLKTLEEPPAHVKFIFATTEPQKIPATILSRCQRFDLRRISARDIVTRLREIAEAEKIAVDEDALLAIARGAEGGLRDAESALDQLIAFRGKSIKEEDVLAVFGLAARRTLDDLIVAVLGGDIPKAIALVDELDEAGKDIQRLVVDLLAQFRSILVFQYAGESSVGQDLTEAQADAVREQAGLAEPARVLKMVDILTETDNRIRYALSKRALLETALIRAARAATLVSLDSIIARLEKLSAAVGGGRAGGAAPAAAQEERPTPVHVSRPVSVGAASAEKAPCEPGCEVSYLAERWHEVVERVGHVAPLAKNYLLDAKPVEVSSEAVVIGFDPEFAENKERVDYPRNRKAMQKVLGEILKRDVGSVDFRVLDSRDTLPGDVKVQDVDAEHPRGRHSAAVDPERAAKARKTKQEWIDNPAVRKTLEAFNGDIVDIRE
ncbi:MAG: DNA polymerase III subunit tau [Verrucomicrobia bacterium ADurb.Bin345]|nr:MAG: DNA polymerase III subunit tau [Verrucomicrobia bacterium ADurb.Bin345]